MSTKDKIAELEAMGLARWEIEEVLDLPDSECSELTIKYRQAARRDESKA